MCVVHSQLTASTGDVLQFRPCVPHASFDNCCSCSLLLTIFSFPNPAPILEFVRGQRGSLFSSYLHPKPANRAQQRVTEIHNFEFDKWPWKQKGRLERERCGWQTSKCHKVWQLSWQTIRVRLHAANFKLCEYLTMRTKARAILGVGRRMRSCVLVPGTVYSLLL